MRFAENDLLAVMALVIFESEFLSHKRTTLCSVTWKNDGKIIGWAGDIALKLHLCGAKCSSCLLDSYPTKHVSTISTAHELLLHRILWVSFSSFISIEIMGHFCRSHEKPNRRPMTNCFEEERKTKRLQGDKFSDWTCSCRRIWGRICVHPRHCRTVRRTLQQPLKPPQRPVRNCSRNEGVEGCMVETSWASVGTGSYEFCPWKNVFDDPSVDRRILLYCPAQNGHLSSYHWQWRWLFYSHSVSLHDSIPWLDSCLFYLTCKRMEVSAIQPICQLVKLSNLSAATLSSVLLMSGYWSKTALKCSTDNEKRLQ